MKAAKVFAVCAIVAAGAVSAMAQQGRGPAFPGLTLTTPAFEDGGIIPNKHAADNQADDDQHYRKLDERKALLTCFLYGTPERFTTFPLCWPNLKQSLKRPHLFRV